MSTTLQNGNEYASPLKYHEERLPDGVRFVLPKRQLGKVRWIGAAVVAGGLFGLAFLTTWMVLPAIWGWRLVQQGEWFGWAICAFGALALTGVAKCCKLFCFGVAVLSNRTSCEVVIRKERIHVHERFYGLRWVRKIRTPLAAFDELCVGKARLDRSQADDVSIERWLGSFDAAIYAVEDKKQPVVIVPCYPRALLNELVDDLARWLSSATIVDALESTTLDPSGPPAAAFKRRAILQPQSSDIEVEKRTNGITYRVPPAGFAKGPKGLLGFAICWNLLVGVFLTVLGLAAFSAGEASLVFGFLFMVPFVAVGIGVMLAVINMARRETAIVTAGSEVFVVSEGIFGKKTRNWRAEELAMVCVGPSGMSVNHVPIMELQFHGGGGKFGVLSERPHDELLWLAGQISVELGLLATHTADSASFETIAEPILSAPPH